MQSPKPHSFRVVYDIQKNKYYRINKLTGQIEPSSKTGKTPPKFHPNVTGADYQARFRFNHLITVESQKTELGNQKNYQSINHENLQKKTLPAKRITALSTEPIKSRFSEPREFGKASLIRSKNFMNNVLPNQIQQPEQIHRIQKIRTLESDSVTLPKLQRKISQSRLVARAGSTNAHFKLNPPLLNKIRYSQSIADNSLVSYKNNNKPRDHSFVASMNRLTIDLAHDSVSQSRMNLEKFQSNLKKYSEIQQNKLLQNNFRSVGNDQKSKKLQKFAEKSQLTSILDESHFTLDQTNSRNNQSRLQRNERKTVTRTEVQKNLQQLSQQKAFLILLQKNNQTKNKFPNLKDRNKPKKQPQPIIKAVDLKNIEEHEKLKTQIQQQKEAFLSFYPGYAFKENPRAIKEQKDRKINLKMLQKLYLENNERKFCRIYNSESKQKLG